MACGYDITVIQSDNPPIAWRFKLSDGTLFPLDGSNFLLSIVWPGGSLVKDSTLGGLAIDIPGATVTWKRTLDEGAMIPRGCVATYKLLRIVGTEQRTMVTGSVIGSGG